MAEQDPELLERAQLLQKAKMIQMSKSEPASNPDTGVAQTALEHFGKGASLGYLPQLQAGAEKAVDTIGDVKDKALDIVGLGDLASIDFQLRKKGFKLPDSTYTEVRDANIKRQAEQAKVNPGVAHAADIAGGLTTGIATSGLLPEVGAATTIAGKVAQGAVQGAKVGGIYGAVANPGDVEGEVSPLQLKQRAMNAGKGAATGAVIGGAVPIVAKGVSTVANKIADKLQNVAEDAAVNATGATGKQASKFSDDAGRELLDRGIVKFGDNQAKISERAQQAVDAANKQIDSSLSKLEADGVKVDGNAIYKTIRDKINELKSDPSQADIAKNLENELDNLLNSTDAKDSTTFGVKEAEQIKRGYNRKAGNWADPEKSQAGKEMYQTYRGAVEDAAQKADPATAKLFEEGKKAYGMLSPIQEAAERRAATTSQSPAGGLADIAAATGGFVKGGPVGALAAPIARRVIAPRLASSIAITADALADQLRTIPKFANLETSQPAAFQALVSRMSTPSVDPSAVMRAADQNAPTKGPDKWANDGLSKLIQHSGDPKIQKQLSDQKSSMLSDPKLKQLLISASDLKPGTPAMNKIMDKIINRSPNGGK